MTTEVRVTHTPGPWTIYHFPSADTEPEEGAITTITCYADEDGSEGATLAEVNRWSDGDDPPTAVSVANACLISAAPELLELLRHWRGDLVDAAGKPNDAHYYDIEWTIAAHEPEETKPAFLRGVDAMLVYLSTRLPDVDKAIAKATVESNLSKKERTMTDARKAAERLRDWLNGDHHYEEWDTESDGAKHDVATILVNCSPASLVHAADTLPPA